MSLEVSPMGVTCNLSCPYCYEHPMREAGNFLAGDIKKPYDVDLMIRALEKKGTQFSMFGGEPLLTDLDDLEKIWKWGYDRYKSNGVQTNGTLIDDAWCAFFREWNAGVGVSIDGPRALHDRNRRTRSGAGTFDRTIAGIRRLRAIDAVHARGIELVALSLGKDGALYLVDMPGYGYARASKAQVKGWTRLIGENFA